MLTWNHFRKFAFSQLSVNMSNSCLTHLTWPTVCGTAGPLESSPWWAGRSRMWSPPHPSERLQRAAPEGTAYSSISRAWFEFMHLVSQYQLRLYHLFQQSSSPAVSQAVACLSSLPWRVSPADEETFLGPGSHPVVCELSEEDHWSQRTGCTVMSVICI